MLNNQGNSKKDRRKQFTITAAASFTGKFLYDGMRKLLKAIFSE